MENTEYWKFALEAVSDAVELGIYPKSINGVPRTEWQDGYNKACIEMQDRLSAYLIKCQNPDDTWRMKVEMLAEEVAFWAFDNSKEGSPKDLFSINLNDVFYWACADSEEVSDAELPLVYEMWKKFPVWGVIGWACNKRGEKPQEPWFTHGDPATTAQKRADYAEALSYAAERYVHVTEEVAA